MSVAAALDVRRRRRRAARGSRSAAWAPSRGGPAGPRRRCVGAPADRPSVRARGRAAELAPADAAADNAFKVELAQRAIVRGLTRADPNGRLRHDRAIGRPVARVDGPAKVTGAARYTAEIALPGSGPRGASSARRSPAAGSLAIDAAAARARPTACWRCSPTTTCPRSPASRTCCRRWSARPAPGRELLPDAGRRRALRRPAGGDGRRRDARAGRSTRRRWCGVRYEPTPVGHHDRPGPRPAPYEAERLFGGLMPGRNERGDVEAALAAADVRRRGRRTGWRPTTTTRWRRRPRPPSGTAAG